MSRTVFVLSAIAIGLTNCPLVFAKSQSDLVLTKAHSHNDYYRQRPLVEALEHGFCSVEADVILKDGKLMVGHYFWELRPERTLQTLYLDPLKERVRRNAGWVFGKEQPFTLMVDIKSKSAATYVELKKVLQDYREMLSSVKDGKLRPRAVQIVLSGDRPRQQVKADKERYVFIDGRLNELQGNPSEHLVPLVSASWSSQFSWRGQGPMPVEQRAKLLQLVEQMHSQERRLRFWATPDDPAVWAELADTGVDLIGTDDLDALKKFWSGRAAQ